MSRIENGGYLLLNCHSIHEKEETEREEVDLLHLVAGYKVIKRGKSVSSQGGDRFLIFQCTICLHLFTVPCLKIGPWGKGS